MQLRMEKENCLTILNIGIIGLNKPPTLRSARHPFGARRPMSKASATTSKAMAMENKCFLLHDVDSVWGLLLEASHCVPDTHTRLPTNSQRCRKGCV